jgi:hypothetical protein
VRALLKLKHDQPGQSYLPGCPQARDWPGSSWRQYIEVALTLQPKEPTFIGDHFAIYDFLVRRNDGNPHGPRRLPPCVQIRDDPLGPDVGALVLADSGVFPYWHLRAFLKQCPPRKT